MEPEADVVALNRALVDLQHQLDLLLGDLANLQTVAQAVSPNLMRMCRHLEILITEADAVLRVPELLGPSEQPEWLH